MNREKNLDNFDPNNQQNDEKGKNDFFRNRGGRQYSGTYNNGRGGNNYGNRRPYYRERGDYPDFHNNNNNRRLYFDNNSSRDRGFNRGPYRLIIQILKVGNIKEKILIEKMKKKKKFKEKKKKYYQISRKNMVK